jgi:hypothetical protein
MKRLISILALLSLSTFALAEDGDDTPKAHDSKPAESAEKKEPPKEESTVTKQHQSWRAFNFLYRNLWLDPSQRRER